MQSISFKCSFDTIEGLKQRAALMIEARNLIEGVGGELVRTATERSPAIFKVPSTHYNLLLDQLDDLALREIVKFRKDSEEIDICIDNL